jgi:hypothetical protein
MPDLKPILCLFQDRTYRLGRALLVDNACRHWQIHSLVTY